MQRTKLILGMAIAATALTLVLLGTNAPIVAASTLTVTKTADTNDGVCNADCSLREAIGAASPGDTINIPSGTYTLTLGSELTIAKGLTLAGAGADSTIIQAAAQPNVASSRVFSIIAGTVAISGVTIRHGSAGEDMVGGGIALGGTLTLTDTTVSGNTAGGNGGGISIDGGTLTLTNSTVSSNTAELNAGGIHVLFSTAILTNTTVSGNTAMGGGGIYNWDTLTLTNSTVSGNTAMGGGGVYNNNGTANIVNTVLAGNSAAVGGSDCWGIINSQGYNLIQSSSGCTITGDMTGDIYGLNPLLGPLTDNGGPTFTHALLLGSPAIEAGNPAAPGSGGNACEATDQRGVARPQGIRCDIGAFEMVQAPPAPTPTATAVPPTPTATPVPPTPTATPVPPTPTPTLVPGVSTLGMLALAALLMAAFLWTRRRGRLAD